MVKLYPGLLTISGNLMVSVDLETTGVRAGYHDIIQIAIMPLDSSFRPLDGVRPFYTTVAPRKPERAEPMALIKNHLDLTDLVMNAPSSDRVVDLLIEWFEKLELPFGKRLVPMAHNWAFEQSFLSSWLGPAMMDDLFHFHARDSMLYAIGLNDKAESMGEAIPFARVSLGSLCNKLGIINTNPHDALADCMAGAELYRELLKR